MPDSVRPCRNYVELHIILLYFPAFCDTILILINFTAENSRWNINIFAKVFPAKSPQIHPTISEFAETKSDGALIQVIFRDSGYGMKEEEKERIFDKFYRGDLSHHFPGNGLGLPLAKKIVTLHGGTITCESAPGKGSAFTVTLPLPPANS